MPLVIDCPCGKKLKVRDELAGKKVKCPGCGQTVLAPAPVVVEPVGEEVVAGEPPIVASTAEKNDAASTEVSAAPIWATKKKSPSRVKREDDDERDAKERDDEDEDKPGPHWVFPGTLSSEVMVLGAEGIWFASLKGDALKKATRLLKNGEPPAAVLGEKAWYIPWTIISSIFCNRKLNGLTINYTFNSEATTKILSPADRDERDEILKSIEKFLGSAWERKTVKHTAVTATVLPIVAIIVTFAITIGVAILSLFVGGDWEGRGRGAAVAALLNLLNWLGPLGTCGIGFLIGVFMVLWMLVRMLNPPIEVTLAPVPADKLDDD